MRALVVVDIQHDFLPGGALAVPSGDGVIAITNLLMARYDRIVATQDWHPADHASFAAQHAGRTPGEVVDLDGLPQVLWPVHCVQGTPGAAFASSLDVWRFHAVFRKGADRRVDSYSGFFDNGRRHDTGLGAWLRTEGVTAVDVVGLATDYCVKWTALDALHLGFPTRLITDACRGVNLSPGDVDGALAELAAAGVGLVTSDDDDAATT